MTTKKSNSKKTVPTATESVPWHKQLWVRIIGGITVIGAILTVIDTTTNLLDRFYKPTPTEILVYDLPIRIKYDKNSSLTVKARVPYTLQVQTHLVDMIENDSIKISEFKINNKQVVNIDSVTTQSLQIYPGQGYGTWGDEVQSTHQIEYNFNAYITLLPSVVNSKSGKVFEIGYAVFSVPYLVRGLRKLKSQKVPIELEIK